MEAAYAPQVEGTAHENDRLFLNKEMGGTRQTERAKRQSSRKGRNTNRRAGRAVTKMSFAAQDILKNGITAMIQRLPKALDLSVADDAQYVNQNGHSAVLQASCHAAGHLFLVRRVVFPEFLLHNHARALVSAPVMAPYTSMQREGAESKLLHTVLSKGVHLASQLWCARTSPPHPTSNRLAWH